MGVCKGEGGGVRCMHLKGKKRMDVSKRTLEIRGRASLFDDGGQRFDETGVFAVAGEVGELAAGGADAGEGWGLLRATP